MNMNMIFNHFLIKTFKIHKQEKQLMERLSKIIKCPEAFIFKHIILTEVLYP